MQSPSIAIDSDSDSAASSSSSLPDAPSNIPALRGAVRETGSYTAHEQLLSALVQTGDLPEIRTAREQFAHAYPLSPTIWTEWISDEARIAVTDAEKLSVLDLYESAVKDYLSIPLHHARLQYAITLCQNGAILPDKVAEAFGDSERRGACAHFTESQSLWECYERFVQNEDHANLHREQYKPLKNDGSIHETECAVFEKRLQDAIDSSADQEQTAGIISQDVEMAFLSYASHAQSISERTAVSVYERAITMAFFHPGIWRAYIDFIQTKFDNNCLRDVCLRATRNIPHHIFTWAKLLQAVSSTEQLVDLLSKAKKYIMVSNDLSGAQRMTRDAWTVFAMLGGPESAHQIVQESLEFCVPDSVEWASACVHIANVLCSLNRVDEAAQVMEQVVKVRALEGRWWLSYVELVQRYSSKSGLVDIFERAMKAVQAAEVGPIEAAWESFVVSDIPYVRRGMDISGSMSETIGVGEGSRMAKREEWFGLGAEEMWRRIRRIREMVMARQSDIDRREEGDNQTVRKRERVPTGWKVGETKRKRTDARKRADGPVPGRTEDTDKMEEDTQTEGTPIANGQGSGQSNQKGKRERSAPKAERKRGAQGEVEPNTIFINNLVYDITEGDLRNVFKFAGEIGQVRIPRRADGASKGIAYIEFVDEVGVDKALTRHQKPIKGRSVWVRKSKPPGRKNIGRSGQPRGRGKWGGKGGAGMNPIAMVPRALRRKMQVEIDGGAEGQANGTRDADTEMAENVQETADNPKSQDDFRAMFMQKKE